MTNRATAAGSAREIVETAQDWLASHGRVALATVVDTWGSAPVPIGSQMVIAADDAFAGSVSGGCVEADVIAEAAEVLADGRARVLSFGVADETAWAAGLPCGGNMRVLVQRLTREGDGREINTIIYALRRRLPLVVATQLADGRRQLVRDDAEVTANDPPGEVVAQALRDGASRLLVTERGEVFVHALMPRPRVVIVGATHIAQELCALARITGYEATVVDPRSAFATPERFPGTPIIAEWPEEALARIAPDRATAIVVVAHIAHIDDQALIAALRSHVRYVGALGSKRNHAKRTARLAAAGFSREEIARIHAPVGLDIGARTPAEIAISVMAEIIQAFRGKRR